MGQFQWTVLGQTGKQYKVGIYHGDKSGHLLIYCNAKVVQVDFSVKESKDYSFFIDDEFFELEVEKKDGAFLYGLKLNTTADTPLNNLRKEKEKSDWAKSIIFAIVFILLISGLVWAIPKVRAMQSEADKTQILAEKGVDGIVEIRFDSINGKFNYFFVGKGNAISKKIDKETTNLPFPLSNGDKFPIRFAKNNPELHQVKWQTILPQQIEKYKSRTAQIHKKLNPSFSDTKINCQIDLAFRLDSLNGLKHLFFQNESLDSNPEFNQTSYEKYIRGEPFRRLSKENCWP